MLLESSVWQRLSRPLRRARWRLAGWSSKDDREFHDRLFDAQQHDPFSRSYPGYLTIRRFADLAQQHFTGVASAVDLGCGPGEITCELARRLSDVRFTGVDHSQAAIRRARAHAERLGLRNVSFEVGDIEHYVPSAPVDLVMMFDSFHHVLDPAAFVQRVRTRCRSVFLIEPAGRWTGDWDRRHDLDWLPRTVHRIRQRLEAEFDLTTESAPSPAVSSEVASLATEHRYTLTDLEAFFEGFSLDLRGTIAGLEEYGPRPYDRSPIRERFGDLIYALVVALEEALVAEELDLSAKHWAVHASIGAAPAGADAARHRGLRSSVSASELLPTYSARYSGYRGPVEVRPGELFQIQLKVKNLGWLSWSSGAKSPVLASYRWLDGSGRMVVQDGLRTPLAWNVEQDSEEDIVLRIEAPSAVGEATLLVDLVHEGVTWFSEQGVPPFQQRFRVRS